MNPCGTCDRHDGIGIETGVCNTYSNAGQMYRIRRGGCPFTYVQEVTAIKERVGQQKQKTRPAK